MAFGLWIQIIRLLIAALCLFIVKQFKCETPACKLDQHWLIDFFTGCCVLFVFINLLFLLPVGLIGAEPTLISLILKLFCGACISLFIIISKGFTLYNDLDPDKQQTDQSILLLMRYIVLLLLCVFSIYLSISFMCLVRHFGIDGQSERQGSVYAE